LLKECTMNLRMLIVMLLVSCLPVASCDRDDDEKKKEPKPEDPFGGGGGRGGNQQSEDDAADKLQEKLTSGTSGDPFANSHLIPFTPGKKPTGLKGNLVPTSVRFAPLRVIESYDEDDNAVLDAFEQVESVNASPMTDTFAVELCF